MLRFEGGKANANALQTVATAINSEPKREGDRTVVGHKRSPENVSNFENEQKRVKLEATNGDDATNGKCKTIVLNASFNFRLNQPLEDPSIIQVISGFAKSFVTDISTRKHLQYKWASISILWSRECIFEYEAALPRRWKEHNDLAAFWALAQGCKESHIDSSISSIQYTNSDSMNVEIQAVVKTTCPEDILYPLLQYAFQSPPAPLHYTMELFNQHLQPTVSHHIDSRYIAPELRPQLLPFQAQNVEWMVNTIFFYLWVEIMC
jgi:hypothetical protein